MEMGCAFGILLNPKAFIYIYTSNKFLNYDNMGEPPGDCPVVANEVPWAPDPDRTCRICWATAQTRSMSGRSSGLELMQLSTRSRNYTPKTQHRRDNSKRSAKIKMLSAY